MQALCFILNKSILQVIYYGIDSSCLCGKLQFSIIEDLKLKKEFETKDGGRKQKERCDYRVDLVGGSI